MKFIRSIFLLISSLAVFLMVSPVHATINFAITPIKYELELRPGESITLPASIRNKGDTSVTLPTTASDFQANGTSGIPSIVRKSELVYPDQQLSTWISISQPSVTLAPGEEKSVDFTIQVPQTATPGGHYGAVLFKNDNSQNTTSGNIGIHVDYGIIILVHVDGEIVVDVDISDPTIGGSGIVKYDHCDGSDTSGSIFDGSCGDSNIQDDTSSTGSTTHPHDSNTVDSATIDTNPHLIPWYVGEDANGNPLYEFPDDCPLGDFTNSRYDKRCIDLNLLNGNDKQTDSQEEKFDVSFSFPIKNKGNTHVKPTGKIVLQDEDGNTLKAIGKESILNDAGAVIGEKIVDYIPVNASLGNVLPYSQRIFESNWKGFPYKDFDAQGNIIVKYWSPSEYYTRQNQKEGEFLMFWERVSEVRTHKNITALISIVYNDADGNPVEFNTAQDFPVQYIEQRVTFNPYIILALLLLSTLILMSWFAIRWWILVVKKHRCWNCEESIKSHWQTCPYCNMLQDKKKYTKFKKLQKEKSSDTSTSTQKKTKKKRGRPKKKPE